jgi:hypothetical protein
MGVIMKKLLIILLMAAACLPVYGMDFPQEERDEGLPVIVHEKLNFNQEASQAIQQLVTDGRPVEQPQENLSLFHKELLYIPHLSSIGVSEKKSKKSNIKHLRNKDVPDTMEKDDEKRIDSPEQRAPAREQNSNFVKAVAQFHEKYPYITPHIFLKPTELQAIYKEKLSNFDSLYAQFLDDVTYLIKKEKAPHQESQSQKPVTSSHETGYIKLSDYLNYYPVEDTSKPQVAVRKKTKNDTQEEMKRDIPKAQEVQLCSGLVKSLVDFLNDDTVPFSEEQKTKLHQLIENEQLGPLQQVYETVLFKSNIDWDPFSEQKKHKGFFLLSRLLHMMNAREKAYTYNGMTEKDCASYICCSDLYKASIKPPVQILEINDESNHDPYAQDNYIIPNNKLKHAPSRFSLSRIVKHISVTGISLALIYSAYKYLKSR